MAALRSCHGGAAVSERSPDIMNKLRTRSPVMYRILFIRALKSVIKVLKLVRLSVLMSHTHTHTSERTRRLELLQSWFLMVDIFTCFYASLIH